MSVVRGLQSHPNILEQLNQDPSLFITESLFYFEIAIRSNPTTGYLKVSMSTYIHVTMYPYKHEQGIHFTNAMLRLGRIVISA